MKKVYVLYNAQSHGINAVRKKITKTLAQQGEVAVFTEVSTVNYDTFFAEIESDAKVMVAGGDGSLSRFMNDVYGKPHSQQLWYYPAGNGNDFFKDITNCSKRQPVCIDGIVAHLPCVTINGNKKMFVNGVGMGFDGLCTHQANVCHEKGKRVSYFLCAVKAFLSHFQRPTAVITVDGVKHVFNNVWFTDVMNGRYCGGGMMFAPKQDRFSGNLTVFVMHDGNVLKTLLRFPKIFKGKHERYSDMCTFLTGKEITVCYNAPHYLQADGDVTENVSEITVRA